MRLLKTMMLGVGVATALGCTATEPADSIAFANTIKIYPSDSPEVVAAKAAHVIPTPQQARAMDREFIAFVHFGPNTFSRREWGTGFEDPKDFTLENLDTDQWAKSMADAGMKMVILTVKHHDGFVIWQSRYTDHGIMSSPFMNGKGDVLKSLAASARKYGLNVGIYLSPADLYQIENEKGLYGNLSKKTLRTIPRPVEGRPFESDQKFEFVVDDYNEYFLNQLFELLTEYGPIDEVWFDGAHPKRKGGQTYDYASWKKLIHTLAPNAVVFGREDVRWCGNEAGETRDTEWNVIPYKANPDTLNNFYDMTDQDLGSRARLAEGNFLHYQYPETDVSIRDGWFYRDDEHQRVRNADDVFDMYERSAGGNAVLLLNIPPNREGRFSPEDVSVLQEVGRRIRATYGTDLLAGASTKTVMLPGDKYPSTVIGLPKKVTLNRLSISEPVTKTGERIEEHTLQAFIDGKWVDVASATNIGRKRILRTRDITTDSLRIRIGSSRLNPDALTVTGHYYKAGAPMLGMSRSTDGTVTLSPRSATINGHSGSTASPEALLPDYTIHYTVDGSEPSAQSPVYSGPVNISAPQIKARAYLADGSHGPLLEKRIGLVKGSWKTDAENGSKAFDENVATVWTSSPVAESLTIDLGAPLMFETIGYTPARNAKGAVTKADIYVSSNGKNFSKVASWDFGNLTNDPTERFHSLGKSRKARYVRIVPRETADGNDAAIAELTIYPAL